MELIEPLILNLKESDFNSLVYANSEQERAVLQGRAQIISEILSFPRRVIAAEERREGEIKVKLEQEEENGRRRGSILRRQF